MLISKGKTCQGEKKKMNLNHTRTQFASSKQLGNAVKNFFFLNMFKVFLYNKDTFKKHVSMKVQ